MSEFSLPLRVYIEDTDAGGIVYYVNYLKYMERCRTELLRSFGYGKTAVLDEGLLLVVRSAKVDYLKAARLDDALTVTARLTKVARSYVVFFQEVRLDEQILCTAEVKVACVTQSQPMRPAVIPPHLSDKLKATE